MGVLRRIVVSIILTYFLSLFTIYTYLQRSIGRESDIRMFEADDRMVEGTYLDSNDQRSKDMAARTKRLRNNMKSNNVSDHDNSSTNNSFNHIDNITGLNRPEKHHNLDFHLIASDANRKLGQNGTGLLKVKHMSDFNTSNAARGNLVFKRCQWLNGSEIYTVDDLANMKYTEIHSDIYIFSTFLDNRTGTPTVRMIASVKKHKVNLRIPLWCHFIISPANQTKFLSVSVTYYEMCENHKKPNGAWILSCEIPLGMHIMPCEVIVSSTRKHDASSKGTPLPIVFTHSPQPRDVVNKETFGVCVPPLYGNITEAGLVEFVELTTLLGADHFIFYVYEVKSNVQKILEFYELSGRATVINWKLPFKFPKFEIWYYGQSMAINDCLYRYMGRFEFLMFNDLDEFLVPHMKDHFHWKDVLSNVNNADNICAYSFKSAFFDEAFDRRNISQPKPKNAEHNSTIFFEPFSLLLRNRTTLFSTIRNKVMVRPSRVFELGIHHVSRPWPDIKNYSVAVVPPTTAFVHHYRTCLTTYKQNCKKVTRDTTVLDNFSVSLRTALTKRIKEIEHINK